MLGQKVPNDHFPLLPRAYIIQQKFIEPQEEPMIAQINQDTEVNKMDKSSFPVFDFTSSFS